MKILLIELSAESVTAICALIVSIISVIFTRQALKYQREHNHKSVKPIGVIVAGNYTNNIFVRIDNNGIGPLIIKDVFVESKNQKVNNLIDIIPNEIAERIVWVDYAKELENTAVLPMQNIYLINWKITDKYKAKRLENEIEKDRLDVMKCLNGLKITIHYTDVYENKMAMTKSLKISN